MKITKATFNLFGEFQEKALEQDYQNEGWSHHKKLYISAYQMSCVLLFFAGVFIDFKRDFVWGSASQLLILRGILVAAGLGMLFKYWKDEKFNKSFDYYGLGLMVLSATIIMLLNIMTGGISKTMLPGTIIVTASYYVFLPCRAILILIPSAILAINFIFFYNPANMGAGGHIYTSFLLLAINVVMLLFKINHNKNARTTYLMSEHHKSDAKAKETILSVIGHDLKNPLMIVNMKTAMAKIHIEKGNKEAAIKEIEKIENAANRLYSLLQTLMTWALDGQDGNEVKNNNITHCFERSIIYCKNLAQEKDIEFIQNIQDCEFNFDANMVETIFRNILVNSIKFSPQSKSIVLSGKNSNGQYIVSIKDNGIGMDQETINLILGGKKKSREGTQGEKGFGLGLQLVNNFILQQNAHLSIKSQPDQGTEFIITFNLYESCHLAA